MPWACRPTAEPPPAATITVDTAVRHQQMRGWGVTQEAGFDRRGFHAVRDSVLALAVNDLGISRIRLHVRSGVEHPHDYYTETTADRAGTELDWRCKRWLTVNDNDQPDSINWSGFSFAEIDSLVENVVLPMQRLLAARGERLIVDLNHVAFIGQCNPPTPYHQNQPEEYAELILATFLHLRDKYHFVPDAVEMVLEPDHAQRWTPRVIGTAMIATARRLNAAGFRPEFIAPTTTSMSRAVDYFDTLMTMPGVRPLLAELSFHRYRGVSDATLLAIAERGRRYGVRTAMLEHLSGTAEELHQDLELGRVSSWRQYALAFPTKDDGSALITTGDGAVRYGVRTFQLRQYFKYVRPGAWRVEARSDQLFVRPLAFVNRDGGYTVVARVEQPIELTLAGLAPGRYGASIAADSAAAVDLGDVIADSTGTAAVSVPIRGVLEVHRR